MIRFAIPFMIANLLQALYGAVDMAVVGQFASASGLSAVATGGELMSTINCLITGLTTGGTILIGQYAGAKRSDEISQTIGTMFTFFAIISVVLSAVIFLFIDPMLKAVQTPVPAYEQTKSYVLICSAGSSHCYGCSAGVKLFAGDSISAEE